jgi:UDP-N-acetylglucosamine--N-acetylmuramyl-(pentapeptide) pyrophosphoryl-undecaprenol N-acetylglucosamine transferase
VTALTERPVALTAGGTGGHMFPAVALGAELIERGYRVLLLTDTRGAEYGSRVQGIESHVIPAASPSRGGLAGKLGFLFTMARGAWAARGLLRRQRVILVVGFGGYASFAAAFMAGRGGIPVILHEQNAYLGLANRKLAPHAAILALSFTSVAGIPATRAEQAQTGNPVRPDIIALADAPYEAPTADAPINLFVIGGSQGARVFSEVIPEAFARLDEAERARFAVTQQCRPEDLDEVRGAYDRLGVAAELASFFDDVPRRLAHAHAVICRAGASTCAEVTVAGRPAIFVPYPFAADDHQTHNARALEQAGVGWLMPQPEFTAETLADRLRGFLTDPAALIDAAAAARRAAHPDAATRLADLVEGLLEARAAA